MQPTIIKLRPFNIKSNSTLNECKSNPFLNSEFIKTIMKEVETMLDNSQDDTNIDESLFDSGDIVYLKANDEELEVLNTFNNQVICRFAKTNIIRLFNPNELYHLDDTEDEIDDGLPSEFQIGEIVSFIGHKAKVVAVTFTETEVLYDLEVPFVCTNCTSPIKAVNSAYIKKLS